MTDEHNSGLLDELFAQCCDCGLLHELSELNFHCADCCSCESQSKCVHGLCYDCYKKVKE